jgi:hypothetical protein
MVPRTEQHYRGIDPTAIARSDWMSSFDTAETIHTASAIT